MSAAGSVGKASTSEAKAPTRAPARAGMMMITITVIIMMNTIQIFFMTLPFEKCFTHDQGLLSPLTSRGESLLV